MPIKVNQFIHRLNLAQRFMVASLAILIAGMVGIGAWVGSQIRSGVIHRAAATTALYVDSFVAPVLQELGDSQALSPQSMARLDTLLQDTPLGQQIIAFRIWDPSGRVIYSNDRADTGQSFPPSELLLQARLGQVTGKISNLEAEENIALRSTRPRLLEIYSPVWLSGTDRVVAVAEFYQIVDDLEREIGAAQRRSWLVVGVSMLAIYLLLAGFVRRASDTIEGQRAALSDQVQRLTELLEQNRELHERVRRAAGSVATLHERLLRRIGSELHDGPAQDLALALLRLDSVSGRLEADREAEAGPAVEGLAEVQHSVQNALKEVRAIASGLGLPQLARLTLGETVIRAVRAHERRTGTRVSLGMVNIPKEASLPLKITVYRLMQEALNNAYRHAGGIDQQVWACAEGQEIVVEISDGGPGLDQEAGNGEQDHLGIAGMRERVESLGGSFRVISEPGDGTSVIARLSLLSEGVGDE